METPKQSPVEGKYEYVNFDEELGIQIEEGYMVNIFDRPFFVEKVDFLMNEHDLYQEVKDSRIDGGDYLLYCPVKTGQHWMWEIMSMLVSGNAQHSKTVKEKNWIEFTSFAQIKAEQPAPRVLCSHIPLDLLSNFRKPSTKVIVMLRNLKDVFVSWYYHQAIIAQVKYTWDESFKLSMYSKLADWGNQFDNYAAVWDNYRDDPNVKIIFYEDLKESPETMIESVAQHLGVSYTSELISDITKATSFKVMKTAKQAIERDYYEKATGQSVCLSRKGVVGDWKNLFTVAQNEEFHRKFDEWNKTRQIPMKFE